MSVEEIQAELIKLSPLERDQVAAFLATSRDLHSPESKRELARRHRDMDAGRFVSEKDLARLLKR
jgi:hypothetical protein